MLDHSQGPVTLAVCGKGQAHGHDLSGHQVSLQTGRWSTNGSHGGKARQDRCTEGIRADARCRGIAHDEVGRRVGHYAALNLDKELHVTQFQPFVQCRQGGHRDPNDSGRDGVPLVGPVVRYPLRVIPIGRSRHEEERHAHKDSTCRQRPAHQSDKSLELPKRVLHGRHAPDTPMTIRKIRRAGLDCRGIPVALPKDASRNGRRDVPPGGFNRETVVEVRKVHDLGDLDNLVDILHRRVLLVQEIAAHGERLGDQNVNVVLRHADFDILNGEAGNAIQQAVAFQRDF